MLIINLNAVINENDNVKLFDLQADFGFDFLLIGITHSASTENVDHLFKHFNGSTDENSDSDVKTYQQILKHSIAILIFVFKIDFVRRNLSRVNWNDFN